MEFYIDNRETIKDDFDKVYDPQFRNLDLGDYQIIYEKTTIAIIERKTICDLIASINDGRYREQKLRLLDNYTKKQIIYLIEGDLTSDCTVHNNKIVNKSTVYSSIINMYLRDNINVFVCKNSGETVEFIEMMLQKIAKQGTEFLTKIANSDGIIANAYSCKKSKNITPGNLYTMQLSLIPGISSKTSSIITANFPDMRTFVNELEKLSKEDRIKNLENLKCESIKRKLGKSIANKINDYMFFNKI